MPDKFELMAYLANMTFVMDAHEKIGTTKNLLIVNEFNFVHDDLLKLLEKDHEARKRNDDTKRAQDGAGESGGESRRG